MDVTGTPTNVLERGSSAKDNRLLPLGFSDDHAVYDTTELRVSLTDVDCISLEAGLDRTHYTMTGNPPLLEM